MGRYSKCIICEQEVDRYEFSTRTNICLNCEVIYNGYVGRKGLIGSKTLKENSYRSAKGSGHFPLTFNFIYWRDGRYIQCGLCGKFVYYRAITRDHVYPKSLGGTMKIPACKDCNIAKENMKPIEWAVYASRHGIDLAVIPMGFEVDQEQVEIAYMRRQLYREIIGLIEQRRSGVMAALQSSKL